MPKYNQAPKRSVSLTIRFSPAMKWEAESTGKCGRQPDNSSTVIHTCLTMTLRCGVALLQTTVFVESQLRLTGWKRAKVSDARRGRITWRCLSSLGRAVEKSDGQLGIEVEVSCGDDVGALVKLAPKMELHPRKALNARQAIDRRL